MIHFGTYFFSIIFSYFISTLILGLTVTALGTPRFFSKLQTWFLFSAIFLLLTVFLFSLQNHVVLHVLAATCATFFIIRSLYSDSFLKSTGITLYLSVLSISAELLCIYSFRAFLHLKAYVDFAGNNLYILTGITFTNMSMLLLTATAPAVWWMIKAYRHSKMLFLYCLFPIYQYITFAVCMCLFEKPSPWMIIVGNIFLILGIIVDFILLSSLTNLIHKKQRQEELELLALQQKNEYECYLKIQKQLEQHRLVKHEFANMLSTIHAMVSDHASMDDINNMIDSSNCLLNSGLKYTAFNDGISNYKSKQYTQEEVARP